MATNEVTTQRAAGVARKTPSIGDLIARPDVAAKMRQMLPRHLSPDRMMRVFVAAVNRTPRLGECSAMSLLGAMQVCASLGLEPNTPLGHAYLIPFAKRENVNGRWVNAGYDVQLIIGYRGYIDLARRSGDLVSIHADVVYDGDDFSFSYGSDQHLTHRPGGRRDAPIYAYAFARLKTGDAFEVLPYAQVLAVRDQSQGWQSAVKQAEKYGGEIRSPWATHEHEMAAKTLVRRLAKWLPMSLEFAQAGTIDALSESGRADFAAIAEGRTAELDMIETPALPPVEEDDEAADEPETAPKRRGRPPGSGKKETPPPPQMDDAGPDDGDDDENVFGDV